MKTKEKTEKQKLKDKNDLKNKTKIQDIVMEDLWFLSICKVTLFFFFLSRCISRL